MIDTEINIAIAEACGYEQKGGRWYYDGKLCYQEAFGEIFEWEPNYCNDLNAMHEAEKVLTLDSGQYNTYENQLRMLLRVSGRKVANATEEHKFLTAAARQRAEAFLRALGKWKEES